MGGDLRGPHAAGGWLDELFSEPDPETREELKKQKKAREELRGRLLRDSRAAGLPDPLRMGVVPPGPELPRIDRSSTRPLAAYPAERMRQDGTWQMRPEDRQALQEVVFEELTVEGWIERPDGRRDPVRMYPTTGALVKRLDAITERIRREIGVYPESNQESIRYGDELARKYISVRPTTALDNLLDG